MINFELKTINDGGTQVLDFANNTPNFVEVVVNIDGKEIRGYCYPPHHHKPIRKMRDGSRLPFSKSGRVRAYVYAGIGQYKEEEVDYEVPPFIRFKLNQDRFKQEGINTDSLIRQRLNRKVTFRRSSNNPIEVLEIPY